MPLPLAEFWKRLIQSGLADSSVPRQWAADYAGDHRATPPSDPLGLAQWLVETGRLSPFQASCLLNSSPQASGKTGENPAGRFPVLRIAPLTQSGEAAPPPFAKWLPVSHDSHPDESGLVLQIVPTRLTPVDGDRLRAIAGIRGPGFPALELMALPHGPLGDRKTTIPIDASLDAVGLFAVLPPGKCLATLIASKSAAAHSRWSAAEIVPLIESLAAGMATFAAHGQGKMPHPPMPSPDRIWVPDDSSLSTQLWLDPAEYLSSDVFETPVTIDTDESQVLYAAPEALGGEGELTHSLESQSVYALGCLAYRLRFGQHAFGAAKEEQIRSRQLRFEPPELSAAVAKGAAGEPLLRVLAFALAKDPALRFPSLDAFVTALRATVPADEPSPASAGASTAEPSSAVPVAEPAGRGGETSQAEAGAQVDVTAPPSAAAFKPPAQGKASKPESAAKPQATQSAVSQPPKPSPVVAAPRQAPGPVSEAPPAQPKPPEVAPPPASSPVVASPHAVPAARAVSPEQTSIASEGSAPVGAAIAVAGPAHEPSIRRRSGSRRTAWYVLGSLWIPIFLLIFALALQDPNAPRPVAKRTRPPIPSVIPSVTGNRSEPKVPAKVPPRPPRQYPELADPNSFEVVSDPRMLWAPPSAIVENVNSQPASSATILLPPGPAAILTFDLPHLVSTGLRDVFEPELAPLFERLQKRIALPLDDIRMIAMAWFPGRDGVPEIALAIHLKSPRPLDELTEAWDVSMAQLPGGVTLYAGDDPDSDAFYPHFAEVSKNAEEGTADKSLVDAFAVGSIARISQVAEVEGAAVLLPRQLEELWVTAQPTDAVALLTQPNFLIADARTWVNQTAPTLMSWIQSTLIPECGGLLLRVASVPPEGEGEGKNTTEVAAADEAPTGSRGCYMEVRLAAAPGMDPMALKTKVLAKVNNASVAAEDFLVTREVDPSWRLLASRLPNMWAFVQEQTRSAAIKREVIVNVYLPPLALPQVALGTLLAANTTIGGDTMAVKTLTLEEMLDRPMSVSFGQESLQFAIDTIISEFAADLPEGNPPPKVEIIGGDLQLNGITQNQQVRNFAKTDLPLRTVLTDLMLGANPDRTATGPNDPKQSLIWVIVGEGADAEIRVTTREAAASKNYQLPKEFQLAD
ncbi:serine/threonine-protein kinase [Aporhodopirellula aestuarii]|uniref:Serine/threonine protein kinase n=1 Tax=Aporhodopirellula aestuarii TaxID=2950107 RepID=A0ABT0TXA3_9BACT|nr:serine/threonine protein kinase [Aporhodopirellula aestuarii]MCM2369232.1 serine/threonine protein kinase [Aporhodopirellula aestuarii]